MTSLLRDDRISSTTTLGPPKAVTAVCVALVFVAFVSSWQRFPQVWNDNRSYGFLAAVFCLWLLWQRRDRVTYERAALDIGLVALAAALSLGWLAATIINVQVLHLAALPIILAAWAGATLGRKALRTIAPIALIFLLAVPLWEVFLGPLQWMTAAANGVMIRLASISAVVEWNLIRFPFGTIEIAQSCAGLSYFMSALTISVVYGQMSLKHTKARVMAVLIALSLAIVGNWLRVFGLVVIGFSTKMQSPLMDEHATYGWVIFCVALIGFFLTTRRIERYDADLDARRSQPRESVEQGDDVSDPNAVAPATRLLIASGAALIGPLLYFTFGNLPSAAITKGDVAGVVAESGWTREPLTPDTTGGARWTPAFSGASLHETTLYARAGDQVQVDRLVYATQSQNAELISSRNSMASPQNTLSERVVGPLDDNLRIVQEAVIRTPSGVRLVWYWYRVAGTITPDPFRAKLLELVSFATRGPPSELIAASMPCAATECKAASSTLFRLATGRDLPP